MSIATPALTALAALTEALPAPETDPAGHREYVRALYDAEVSRRAKDAGTAAPAFGSYSTTRPALAADVVRQARADALEAADAMTAALAAVLSQIATFNAALTVSLDRGDITPDEADRRRTEHHALVRTITNALEQRA